MQGDEGAHGVPHGDLLIEFAEAMQDGGAERLAAARRAVRDALGDAAFVDTCATIASFSAVVKIADGAGIPLEDAKEKATRDIREAYAIDDFRT